MLVSSAIRMAFCTAAADIGNASIAVLRLHLAPVVAVIASIGSRAEGWHVEQRPSAP